MRFFSFAWLLLTLLLTGFSYAFLGHNYEQALRNAAIAGLTCLVLYSVCLATYMYLRCKKLL
jgi:hypothetical protein